MVDDDDLTVLHVALEGRADGVQCAGLGGQHPGAVEAAQDQRTDTQRVARTNQLLAGEADKGVAAFDLVHGVDKAVDKAFF